MYGNPEQHPRVRAEIVKFMDSIKIMPVEAEFTWNWTDGIDNPEEYLQQMNKLTVW